MAGVKGMRQTRARGHRIRIWQSMRILRRFTVPDLCRTSMATRENTRKFVAGLMRHGYVAPERGYQTGYAGVYKAYRLVKDIGPDFPLTCSRCGRPLADKCEVADE